MIRTIFIAVAVLVLSGCAVTKDYMATGGSKADGTVKLSYEQKAFEKVTVSEEQGLSVAKERCAAWGYKNAEVFGGAQRQCESSGYVKNCTTTKEYQCLD